MADPSSGAAGLPDDEDSPTTAQGSVESVDPPSSDGAEETPDGGAIVKLDDKPQATEGESDFYANLVDQIDPSTLSALALELNERIEADKESRKERDKKYAEGIERTGIGDAAPGGATFAGASKAVHPVLSKAGIDFEARAIAELMPPAGPVKEDIPQHNPTMAQAEKAKRKSAHMNWQLTHQMPEFRPELEQLLSQLPLAGSQFMYLNWDERRRRPMGTYWPADDVILPYGASNAMNAERLTMVERISQRTYERRVSSGYYAGPVDMPPSTQAEQTESEQAAEKGEGVEPDDLNKDGLRQIWRCFTEVELTGDKLTEGKLAPYTIELNADKSGIKRIVRNWEKDDVLKLPMLWLVEFPFLPWRGALSIGLVHVIGSLSGAATGALRALLDSGHFNNFPVMLKLKGANFSGQTKQINVGTVVELEGGISGINDDIRKLMMPLEYNPPSDVLERLLGVLVTEAEGVVQTTMKNLDEAASNQLPVGTTLAIIEQGMKVFAAVHMRLFHAMTQLLQVLHRINKMYVTDEEIKDETGTSLALRSDYQGGLDVIPVADPNIFSDAQRFAQLQIISQRSDQHPELYVQRKVEQAILERSRIPDAVSFLQPDPAPQQDNAVNENVAMAMGRPVAAFPEQDHLAHLQVHLDFADSPLLAQLPNIAPKYFSAVIDHIGQHIALWYLSAFYHAGSAAVGQELEKLMGTKDPQAERELDKLLAQLSPTVVSTAGKHFEQYPALIGKFQQIMKQYMPQPPPDPSMAVANVKAQSDQANTQTKVQGDIQKTQISTQSDAQQTAAQLASAERQAQLETEGKLQVQSAKDDAAGQRTQETNLTKEETTQGDNQTALTIAAAELAGGHKPGVSTGTGLHP